jgi:hypothetical protein
LEAAFERKPTVHELSSSPQTPAKWRKPIFDPTEVGMGGGSLALIVQQLGMLPLPVRLADERGTPRDYWELQGMLQRLAPAILNVIDEVRGLAKLPAISDADTMLVELDQRRAEYGEGQLRQWELGREHSPDRTPPAPPEPDRFSEEWKEADRPASRWLERTGMELGIAAFDVLVRRDAGGRPDKSLFRPLEHVLDMLSWLAPRAVAPSGSA